MKWVKEERAKKFYRRREAVIKAIEQSPLFVATAPEAAILMVEAEMGGRSLHAFGQGLISSAAKAKTS